MTKAQLEAKVEVLGRLLFEAVHLLWAAESYGDRDRESLVDEFIERCRQEGFV